jgi:hypothetical protein
MTRLPARAVLLAALIVTALACAACSGASAGPADTPEPVVAAAFQAASTTPSPLPTPSPPPGTVRRLTLGELSSAAVNIAAQLGNTIGISVYVPGERVEYEYNADTPFELASVVKLPAMLTLLDQAMREGRPLTDEETILLTAMITESDNDATNLVWDRIGGARGVREFLASAGIDGSLINAADWGESELSAHEAARLLAALIEGTVLDARSRRFAMQLLGRIDPAQDWGVTVAAAFEAETGVKNGWYPESEGWVLNSLGYAIPNDGGSPYLLAIFTSGAHNYYGGVMNIESIAGLLNAQLLSR